MTTRRTFLKSSATALAVPGLAPAAARPDVVPIALVGCGGMGKNHLRLLAQNKRVAITHLCDVDSTRLADAAKIATDAGHSPKATKDLRQVLDDKSVVAVWMA